MKQETLNTLARYVDVTSMFVESLTQQAIEFDAKVDRADQADRRQELADAMSSMRVAQRRLGAALGHLHDYAETLG